MEGFAYGGMSSMPFPVIATPFIIRIMSMVAGKYGGGNLQPI